MSEEVDPTELEAWRRAWRDTRETASSSCLSEDLLAGLLMGDVAPETRMRAADHVVSCRRCAARYRALSLLRDEAPPAVASASVEAAGATTRYPATWRIASLAAAVLVGVGLSWLMIDRRVGEGPLPGSERGGPRAQARAEPADGAILGTAPSRFEWPPEREADSYWIVLYDDRSTPIWTSPAGGDLSVMLPEDERGALEPGRSYFWRVFFIQGVERRQSQLHRFSISP